MTRVIRIGLTLYPKKDGGTVTEAPLDCENVSMSVNMTCEFRDGLSQRRRRSRWKVACLTRTGKRIAAGIWLSKSTENELIQCRLLIQVLNSGTPGLLNFQRFSG